MATESYLFTVQDMQHSVTCTTPNLSQPQNVSSAITKLLASCHNYQQQMFYLTTVELLKCQLTGPDNYSAVAH